MKKHTNTKHSIMNQKCEKCENLFESNSTLIHHMKQHHKADHVTKDALDKKKHDSDTLEVSDK